MEGLPAILSCKVVCGSIAGWFHRMTVGDIQYQLLNAQVKAEKSADSEEMRGMTVGAFSSAPSSSSPQPIRHPSGSPPAIFSPFQSQQQQQLQVPSAQQAAMMELSGHSGPPSMHQHPDKFGKSSWLTSNE